MAGLKLQASLGNSSRSSASILPDFCGDKQWQTRQRRWSGTPIKHSLARPQDQAVQQWGRLGGHRMNSLQQPTCAPCTPSPSSTRCTPSSLVLRRAAAAAAMRSAAMRSRRPRNSWPYWSAPCRQAEGELSRRMYGGTRGRTAGRWPNKRGTTALPPPLHLCRAQLVSQRPDQGAVKGAPLLGRLCLRLRLAAFQALACCLRLQPGQAR